MADRSIVPQRMNPELSPELVQEVAFFLKWGYLVVEEAISQEQVEALREALDEAFDRKDEQFTHQLLEEDDRFTFLLDHPLMAVSPVRLTAVIFLTN